MRGKKAAAVNESILCFDKLSNLNFYSVNKQHNKIYVSLDVGKS